MLVIAGHDPAGAGLQADIETIAALGGRASTLVTCLTTQSSRGIAGMTPTPAALLLGQAACLLNDIRPPAACKIGLVPDLETLRAVVQILALLPSGTPIVVDPVLGAAAGGGVASAGLAEHFLSELLPKATLCTPNMRELRRLAEVGGAGLQQVLKASPWCLAKGADEPGETVVHQLFQDSRLYAEYRWPRIEGVFHGSGCMLASAISVLLAGGMTVAAAVAYGLSYTWRALTNAFDPGGAQLLPSRPPL